MRQTGYSHNFQVTEDFFEENERDKLTLTQSQIEENNQIFQLQKLLDAEKRPADAAVKESQLVALQEEIIILKDRLALVEAENEFLRGCGRKEKDGAAWNLECLGCKNCLCSGSNVFKMIDDEDFCNERRQGEDKSSSQLWCVSTGCFKDNIIVGSAKDALIFTEVFYASSVFCNACLIEVGYCFKQNNKTSVFQTIVNGLYIFNRVQIQK